MSERRHGNSRYTPRVPRLRALGALLLAVGSLGCYRYVPIQPLEVDPTEEVRVRITESAATRLVTETGLYTGQLEGRLAPEGSDSLSISVRIGRAYQGMALESTRQTLFLGRSDVTEVRRRQLSRGRTVLATAGVLVAFGVLINSVIQQADPNTPDDTPPPPPPGVPFVQFRIPIR